ncbi:OsmC family protein [Burkholderia ambifaria]|uniref:OsmC family protein n=1 Tax=Burkholderia ambifaria TaxID=152480 RepID=UPI001E2B7790|nr:OsmC family protein [Burkholderia ambifaria]UEP26164.1 OsmC family protein [Burkholderia ambifaria]
MKMNGIDLVALGAMADKARNSGENATAKFKVKTKWMGKAKTVGVVSEYVLFDETFNRHFDISADEPRELLGENSAPNPQELLMAALNACMSVGFAANAAAMGIKLDKLEIETVGQLDLRGFLGIDPAVKPGYEEVHYTVRVKSDASREQLEELHRAVVKTSPNLSNFSTAIKMVPEFIIENL